MLPRRSTPRRRLHLRRELAQLHGAVEAARILGEAIATSQLGPEPDHRRAPRALTSLLAVVGAHLRTLHRASRRHRRPAPQRSAPAPAAAPPRTIDEQVLALCARRQRSAGLTSP